MKARIWFTHPTAFSLVAFLGLLAALALGVDSNLAQGSDAATPPPTSNATVSPKDEADSLHLVIAADRAAYCEAYVARQPSDAPTAGGASWRGAWPLPAEMFRRAAESIQSKGAEFSYALRSLHPLDPRNAPQTELEQRGLAFVAGNPAQNYYGQEMLGGRRYFTAVYPDLPAATACVDCHNRRRSPDQRTLRAGEPLGGVVVRVPLEF